MEFQHPQMIPEPDELAHINKRRATRRNGD